MFHDTSRWWLLSILIAALALRLTLALVLPFDAGPDERYRYEVVAKLYRENRAPRYGTETAHHFVVKPVFGFRFNAWVAKAVPGRVPLVVRLRFGALLLSLGTVVLAYGTVRNLWPARQKRAIMVAALTAFFPKMLGIGTYLTADAYTAFADTLVLFVLSLVHRRGALKTDGSLLLGLSLGLVFLGRPHGYAAFVLAFVYVLWLLRHGGRAPARSAAVALAIFLAFPAVFYAHQYRTYGQAFIPGVVQSGMAWVPPGYSVAEAYASITRGGSEWPLVHLDWRNPLHWLTFAVPLFVNSFTTFSHHPAFFPGIFYSIFLFLVLCSGVGWWHHAGRMRHYPRSWEERSRRWLLGSALAAILVLVAAVTWGNFTILHQPDGRYLTPLGVPALLLLLLGWEGTFRDADANRFLTACGVAFTVLSGTYGTWALVRFYV